MLRGAHGDFDVSGDAAAVLGNATKSAVTDMLDIDVHLGSCEEM